MSHGVRFRVPASVLCVLCVLCSWIAIPFAGTAKDKPKDKDQAARTADEGGAAAVLRLTNIWPVHLTASPEEWAKLEPKGGGGFFGGPRGGGPGGGPGGRGPGGGFGPGMIVAPAFLKEGDTNADAKLTRKEFEALAEKWFAAWDKEKRGKLSGDSLSEGLNQALMASGGGFGRGPGGPGGPGGRGPGMNLQGAEGKRNGVAAAAGVEFESAHGELEIGGQTLKDVMLRYKGNGTWMQSRDSDKKSLKVDLNDNVKGQKFSGLTKLNFHNNVTDASWMNEVLGYRLYRDAGVPAPHTAYARVSVTVSGKHSRDYLGLYSIVENVDTHFAKDAFGSKKGAIFKPVTPALFADLGDDWKSYNQTYDPKTDLTPEQKQRLIEVCKFVTRASDGDFAARLGDYLDLEEFARYMAVTVWISELDGILGPGQNFYLHLDAKSGRLQFIPWDLDHSFGQFGMRGSQEERENLSIEKPWQGENRFLERVFKVDAFKTRYLARLREFSETLFDPKRLASQVDELAAVIRPSIQEESREKAERFETAVSGKPLAGGFPGFGGPGRGGGDRGGFGGPQPGGPGGPPPGGFGGQIKPIKTFAPIRAESVKDQLAGKSPGSKLGEFGFGPPGMRGGGGRGPGGGPGGGFGPGRFISRGFLDALDTNEDGALSRDEFTRGFAKWFDRWDKTKSGSLTEDQLREGLNEELSPFRGGPPPPP
ncbi:MAG: CotH kinase family protein [Verrucomicrobia bacterium]|nr:CotH kinase family protein [Verrucomicrobiota bacterium]MBI3870573.1 CotH kinase family protein [Verrucomicrobiota bacterium]